MRAMSERRFTDLLGDEDLEYAACVSWVRDLAPEEAFMRLGGRPPFPLRSANEVLDAANGVWGTAGVLYPVAMLGARLDARWTLLHEPNGSAVTAGAELVTLSIGAEVVSVFWNANGLGEIAVARDGVIAALIHDVVVDFLAEGNAGIDDVTGTDPACVADLIRALAGVDRHHDWCGVALAWAERYTRACVPDGWFRAAHASCVFGRYLPN